MNSRLVVVATVVAACSAGAGGGEPLPDAGVLVYGACDPASRVGTFEVDLAEKFTGVQGQVFDGVVPSDILETLETEGDCRRARAPVYFCDPACAVGEACNAQGACVPYPVAHDVGLVTVTGLKDDVEMEALPPANYYTNRDPLPHPGFLPGADIALAAAGGDYPPFRLRGWGVSALEVFSAEIVVEAGAVVPLTWATPSEAGPTRLRISLNVNGHGVTGSRIECEVPDTGAFTLPEPLVTALVNDGLSGFPTLALTRTTADSTDLPPGCVEFRVQSQRSIPVSIPGLVSCDGDEDCTPPETCQSDLTCG